MEITQTKIDKYYKIVQDQIKEGTNINILLNNIMATLNSFESSEVYKSEKCSVSYYKDSLELTMWNLSVLIMSWTLMNLKHKVEEGHCHNIDHPHGDQNPRKCSDGSKFHYILYQKCIKSMYDTLAIIENDSLKYL